MEYRVGSGFDVHRLKVGRPCMLGCVEIPGAAGPYGHSDGDPVAHALADAILGAAGLGDIGDAFPDDDPAWKDCPGDRILSLSLEKARGAGYAVVNADLTIFLERPRLASRKEEIRLRLAEILGIEPLAVSVKAKTGEGFGPVGRGDCAAAHAAVLLRSR